MSVGTTLTLVPTISPADASNPAINWTSTDTAVATVDAGTVTAIAPGTSTVMAITVDGGRIARSIITVSDTVTSDTIIPVTGITLSQTTATVGIGQTLVLTATILPENATNQNLIWTSSNPAVASVLNGTIIGLTAGTATITATTQCGNITASCAVTVEQVVPVVHIELDRTSATMHTIGDMLHLTATVFPENATNQTVTWLSTNPAVATVVDGLVTAVSFGNANIVATSQDGNRSAVCAITITPPIAVTGVTLDRTTVTFAPGSTITLSATVLPENATNQTITWSSSNDAIATVENGVVTAVSSGTATITVATEDGNRMAISLVTVLPMSNCNLNTPNWGNVSLGASFATTQTWTVPGTDGRPTQVWSDAVIANACANRTDFDGGDFWDPDRFNADCRNSIENNYFSGHYFSWCAVMRFMNELCPPDQGWRVPTGEDFSILHANFTGQVLTNPGQFSGAISHYMGTTPSPNGGTWGGARFTGLATNQTLEQSGYWSSTDHNTSQARQLNWSGMVSPGSIISKGAGWALRCIRK